MTHDGSDGTYTRLLVYRARLYAVRKRFYDFPVTAVTRHEKNETNRLLYLPQITQITQIVVAKATIICAQP